MVKPCGSRGRVYGRFENPSSHRGGGNYFETHIHNSQGFAIGENITQNINVANDFGTAINQLLTGVERSTSLSMVEKITLTGEIKMLEQLGGVEKTDEVINAADAKITAITPVLSTTADLVSLGVVVIPIIKAAFGL